MNSINTDDCWLYAGRKDKLGYGHIHFYEGKKLRSVLAHRTMYENLVGAIPPKLVLDHLCRVPSCINPDHLEPVTQRVNLLRGVGFSATNARKTHCPKGHPYVADNVIHNGKNGRRCDICRIAYMKHYRLTHRRKPIAA